MALTVMNLVTPKAAAKLELSDFHQFIHTGNTSFAIVVAAALAAPGATAAKAAAAASYFAQNIYEIETRSGQLQMRFFGSKWRPMKKLRKN
jgi:hypothetical protein